MPAGNEMLVDYINDPNGSLETHNFLSTTKLHPVQESYKILFPPYSVGLQKT